MHIHIHMHTHIHIHIHIHYTYTHTYTYTNTHKHTYTCPYTTHAHTFDIYKLTCAWISTTIHACKSMHMYVHIRYARNFLEHKNTCQIHSHPCAQIRCPLWVGLHTNEKIFWLFRTQIRAPESFSYPGSWRQLNPKNLLYIIDCDCAFDAGSDKGNHLIACVAKLHGQMACASASRAYICSWAPQTTGICQMDFSEEFWGMIEEWLYARLETAVKQ